MDSLTPFDDEDFFGSYDPEKAGGVSLASLDFDAAEAAPTPEQLAHWTRFRRPVAGVVAAMALLSIVALQKHGSQQHGSQRELIAHYGAAIAAPARTATTAAPAQQTAGVPEASSDFVPEALSAFVLEAWSVLVPDASSAANTAPPTLTVGATAPALEPAPPTTALTDSFAQPDSSLGSEFISTRTPMCVLPAGTEVTVDSQSDAAGSRPPFNTNRSISTPAPIAQAKFAPIAQAKSAPIAQAKSAPIAQAKSAPIAQAKPAPIAAPKPPTPFKSVARFPDARR